MKFKKNSLLIFLSLFISVERIYALETDQFMTWGISLSDSRKQVEDYIEKNIRQELALMNSKKKEYSCESATKRLLSWNGRTTNFLSEIEKDMYHALNIDRYPKIFQSERGVVERSIYRDVNYFKLKIFGVSLRAYNVYFGIDKLGHFITTGRDYYKIYSKAIKRGKSEKEAELKAIKRGVFSERTYYGLLISGVFSFADLEANFQGLRFARSFCEGENPLITLEDKKWKLRRKISLENYITPYWDESYYTNSYSRKRFRQIRPYLAKYCELRSSETVIKRMDSYKNISQSNPSIHYLDKLILRGKIKNPAQYSLKAICD